MPSTPKRAAVEYVKTLAGIPHRRRLGRLPALSPDDFWELQGQLLERRYGDAIRHVPHYRESLDYPMSLPVGGSLLDRLRTLPVLEKTTVKEASHEFWRRPITPFVFTHTTGGTTGTPLRIRSGIYTRGVTNAILESRYERICGSRRPRIVRLSGYLDDATVEGKIFERIPGTPVAYLSIYHLGEQHASTILEELNAFRPQIFHGYASALAELARLFPDGQLNDLGSFRCVSTSETLDPSQREMIENNLRTIVHNEYGSQEGQHLVLECEQRGMHIHPLRGIVEILKLDSNEPADVNELGRVVVTGLQNRHMPLFRYSLGDSAYSTGYATDCPCGLQWPRIGFVYGRTEDLVRARDGRRIGLLSHSTLKELDGVLESQVIQTGFGQFTYKIRPGAGYERVVAEEHIRSELGRRLGERVHVDFSYVDRIDKTPAGKVQAVVVRF